MSQAEYTQSQILSQLDACATDYTFPMLDNGYVYLADVRLGAYRTERYWALIIEVLGSNFRASGVFDYIDRFGNCFLQRPIPPDEDMLPVINDASNYTIFPDEDHWDIHQEKGLLRVRSESVPYDVTPAKLLEQGIGEQTWDSGVVTVTELVRSLVPEHHALLLATEEELNRLLPPDLTLILRLDEWHHPDLVEGELPSENEAFQMIADVLVSGDPACYKPTLPPNTHWSNWLESGTL